MAFGGSFKEDHPYATGLGIIIIAAFGVAGSVTGQLAAMLAALWVPSALEANQAGTSSANSGGNPLTQPLTGSTFGVKSASTGQVATGSTINTSNAPTVGSVLSGGGSVSSA